ncbi:hypothetical protein JCM17961_08720 [Endothiovibrio diazotrophicus]
MLLAVPAATAPDPDHRPAVWGARADGTLKLDAADASPLLALPAEEGLRARLWGYGGERLRGYAFDGSRVIDTRLPMVSHCGLGNDRHYGHNQEGDAHWGHPGRRSGATAKDGALALQPRDGTLWLAVDQCLYRFDVGGALTGALESDAAVVGIAADTRREWLATCSPQASSSPPPPTERCSPITVPPCNWNWLTESFDFPGFIHSRCQWAGRRVPLRAWESARQPRRPPSGGRGGKSGLHRAGCQVTPGRRESTESGTEKIPPMAPFGGTGKVEMVR